MSEMPDEEKVASGIAEAPRFKSVINLMDDVEAEIESLKSGTLPEGKARVVRSMRALQFRGVELFLQAARIDRSLSKDLGKEFKRQAIPASNGEAIIEEPIAPVAGETETERPNPAKTP